VRRRRPLNGKNKKNMVNRDGLRDHLAERHPRTTRRTRPHRTRPLGNRGPAALGDVVYDEDRSQIRTGNGSRVMAGLRLTGHASVAAALRYHARQPGRPLQTIMQC
jgi:hypothetical protein